MPEWFRLSGILIIVIGLALKLRPAAVVAVAALVTGLTAGLPLFSRPGQEGLVDMLGRAFAEYRLMTLFLLTLPAIGLAEKYGLQERSARLIRGIGGATVGRLLVAYQLFRVLHGMLGIRLNGHPVFVRPLVYPMARGVVPDVDAATEERLKGAVAAAENYGNFFGQNLSPVQPGILLVYSVLTGLGQNVTLWRLVMFAIPIAVLAVVLGAVQFAWLDRQLRRKGAGQ